MFVVEVIVWAAVWRIASRIIFKSNAFLLTLHAATPKQANKAKFEKNVAALVHATFATLTAVYYLPWLTQWDVAEKYNCGDFWHTWHQVIPASFSGYIVQDLYEDISLARVGLVPLPVDMVIHHILFLAVVALQLVYEKGCFVYFWLILTEGSTIPLLIRWFAIASEAVPSVIDRLNMAFALSFFVLRVGLYGYFLYEFVADDLHVFRSPYLLTSYQIIPVLLVGGYLLNLVWFQQLIARAFAKR